MSYHYQDENKPIEPKSIFHVPVSPQEPQRERPAGFGQFQGLTGVLDLRFRVKSKYLYVGSGEIKVDEKNRSYYAFARRGERLIVPGTGIKGPVRSIFEALTNSCVPVIDKKKGEEYPDQHQPCRTVQRGHEHQARLCPACCLFGTTGWRGRVHFSDAIQLPSEETKLLVPPQIIKIGDLWEPHIRNGRKFYQHGAFQPGEGDAPEMGYRFVEALPGNSSAEIRDGIRFRTRLFFENVSEAEMCAILFALGLKPSQKTSDTIVLNFPVKLGGAKPRCLGAVEFTPLSLRIIPSSEEKFFASLTTGGQEQPVGPTLYEWMNERNRTLVDLSAFIDYKNHALKPQNEPCPKELY